MSRESIAKKIITGVSSTKYPRKTKEEQNPTNALRLECNKY